MAQPLLHNQKYTYEQFLEIAKDIERVEFVDGEIYYQATPTLEHQNIILNIASEFRNYFKGKDCKPFIAPFDIILEKEGEENKRVQPDVFILCGEKPTKQNEYKCVPTLIVEVLSPSNVWWDTSVKFDLYQRFGVKEYWMVKPKGKTIEVYNLDENGLYCEPDTYSKNDIVKSNIFENLNIDLKLIFE